MKNILTIISILFCVNVFAQTGINVNPNQNPDRAYFLMSTPKKNADGHKRKVGKYEVIGQFTSYNADTIVKYLKIAGMIHDSLSGAGGGFFTSSVAVDDVSQNASSHSFELINLTGLEISTKTDDIISMSEGNAEMSVGNGLSTISANSDNGITLTASDSTYSFGQLPHIDTGQVTHALGINSADGTVAITPIKYKVYTALLTQSGTSAPVATVLENTLDTDNAWGYFDVGFYYKKVSDDLIGSSVYVTNGTVNAYGAQDFGVVHVSIAEYAESDLPDGTYIIVTTTRAQSFGTPANNPANDVILSMSIEARIYN